MQFEAEQNTNEQIRNAAFTPPNPLSKNQLKKQLKLKKYEEQRKEKRLREKLKQKLKRKEAVAKGLPAHAGPTRQLLKKRQQNAKTNESNIQVVIDLDYDDLMLQQDVAKCVKQCLRIYTINRRAAQPVQLHFTGIKRDGHIHAALQKNHGWENWHVNYHFNQTHLNLFAAEQLVYLTVESDTVLQELTPGSVYVIGGLVDHNHHKGLCHERATKNALKTARLPLSEHVDMKTRSVLSTFHVFEILLRVSEGKSWTEAILQTLPQRKGATAKIAEQPQQSTITEKGSS